ncbi:MAG: hypothetical protein RLP98_04820 [Devosia sp.]
MYQSPSLAKAKTNLDRAIVEKNWADVDKVQLRISEILVDAVANRATEQVSAVKSVVADAFAKIVLISGVRVGESADRAAWSLNSVALLADVAATFLPPVEASAQPGASDKILQRLARSNVGRLTNKDLAKDCGLAEETVARTLPRLISDNLVISRKSGRARFTEITERGRWHLQKFGVTNYSRINSPQKDLDFVVQSGKPQLKVQHLAGKRSYKSSYEIISQQSSENLKVQFQDDVTENLDIPSVPEWIEGKRILTGVKNSADADRRYING